MFSRSSFARSRSVSTRFLVPVLAVALSLVASSAFARGKGGKGGRHFPMPAAEFKTHSEARLAKAKERLEAHITKQQLPAEKAKELRDAFAAGVAKVNAQIDKAVADGTVTKEEAKEVRAVMKEARAGAGGRKHGKHGKHAKKA
jgi:hypothetical protein